MTTVIGALLVTWLAISQASPLQVAPQEDLPDVGLTTPEMIARQGYPVELHHVTTEDGYVLELHRLPRDGAPVMLLQHGAMCSSADWVLMGPEKGLAYILYDQGYDVWLGNARGNVYSKTHTSLTTEDPEYWDFTWHEMGVYDLPAVFDHILDTTGETQLAYTGHSMGTTMFWVMGSERPEYNDKVKVMFALAPVAFMGYVRTPLRLLAPYVYQTEWILNMMGLHGFEPSSAFLEFIGKSLCSDGAISQGMCSNALFLVSGYDSQQLNETTLPVIFSHTPAGASTKYLLHYTQEINSFHFWQYDYGWAENTIRYGSIYPPKYDLGKVTAPVYLMYSDNDWLAHPIDVTSLENKLGNAKAMIRVPLASFNHLDFLWAIDVVPLLYDTLLDLLEKA